MMMAEKKPSTLIIKKKGRTPLICHQKIGACLLLFVLFVTLFSLTPLLEAMENDVPPPLMGLEKDFSALFNETISFDSPYLHHYLEPNERGVVEAQHHLSMQLPGLLISVGTERSLFSLILSVKSSGRNCLGLVVRDVDPKVKGYLDFAVLLFRISTNTEDFRSLTECPRLCYPPVMAEEEYQRLLEAKLIDIRERLEQANLPLAVKAYYRRHLPILFSIYMEKKRFWELEYPEGFLDYHKDDELFAILQRYANDGNILITIGEIGDLHFLVDYPIGLIDLSNVPDFSMFDLKNDRLACEPRVVWTKIKEQSRGDTWAFYYSCLYHPLPKKEREEMNLLIDDMARSHPHPKKKFSYRMMAFFLKKWNPGVLEPYCFPSYTYEFLSVLRNYSNRKDYQ